MTPGRAIVALTRERPGIALTWYVVVGGFGARSFVVHDDRVWAYLTFLTVLTGILALADRAVGFSDHVLWLLLVAGTAHLSGGLLPGWHHHAVLYDAWLVDGVLRFDQVVHAFGSMVATVAMWEVLGTYLDLGRTRPRTQALIAGLASLGKGAINEVIEFLMSLGFAGDHVGGYTNTGWDLTFNLLGAACAGTLLVGAGARRRPRSRSTERSGHGPDPSSGSEASAKPLANLNVPSR